VKGKMKKNRYCTQKY